MEDDNKKYLNGRRPQFLQNGRRPDFFQTKDNLKQLNVT
jgi:hypothetical protein